MSKIGELWQTKRWLFIVLLLLLVGTAIAAALRPDIVGVSVLWILICFAAIVVMWLLVDALARLFRRFKQRDFDAKVAAREGVDDRKAEWSSWTATMRERGIDRYELPFYMLVGEPQSGKSVMLHNSDLHFPFGTSRLSGPGGTRGCDWWFTDEAVILDLAGRLFTHEGGASDEAEWEAFLGLLSEYRPLSPANGIILVVPCDSLLENSADTSASKAGRIKDALLTLVGTLQAQLPIYVVLTKADKVFGFAETVHRLGAEKRQEMFGWSRPAVRFDHPFSVEEFREGFNGMVGRAQLLRARTLSEARIPDALSEIDRAFAFPEELRTLRDPLEVYLKRIFSESKLVDLLFFRGVYLSSGLQKGVPIAQACAGLIGGQSAADSRALEGLFTRQRAYFIRDLIRERVFSERGLVRPTSARVRRSRRVTLIGYGTAAALAVLGAIWSAVYVFSQKNKDWDAYTEVIESVSTQLAQLDSWTQGESEELTATLAVLAKIKEGIDHPRTFQILRDNGEDFRRLYAEVVRSRLLPVTFEAAAARVRLAAQPDRPRDFLEFRRRLDEVVFLIEEIDLRDEADLEVLEQLVDIAGTDSSGSWGLAEAIATYEECVEGDERLVLLSDELPEERTTFLEDAAKSVEKYFGAVRRGDFDQGFVDLGSLPTREQELAKVLSVFQLVEKIKELRLENEVVQDRCVSAKNCQEIETAYRELERWAQAEGEPICHTLFAEALKGAGDVRGLLQKRDLILARFGVLSTGGGSGDWGTPLLALVKPGSSNTEGITGVTTVPIDEKRASVVRKNARRTQLPALGKRKALLAGAVADAAAAFPVGGSDDEEPVVMVRVTLEAPLEELISPPFASLDEYRQQRQNCNEGVFRGEWRNPNEIIDAIRESHGDGDRRSLADVVANAWKSYESQYSDFDELADALGPQGAGGVSDFGFHVAGLKHLAELRAELVPLQGTSSARADELKSWIGRLEDLYEKHVSRVLKREASEDVLDERRVTFDVDLAKALCMGVAADQGRLSASAREGLDLYMRVVRNAYILRWSSEEWGRGDGLRNVLKELNEFLRQLQEVREETGLDHWSLALDSEFKAGVQDALEAQKTQLETAIRDHWLRRLASLRSAYEGELDKPRPAVIAAAVVVKKAFSPRSLSIEGSPQGIDPVLDALAENWTALAAAAQDWQFLDEIKGWDELSVTAAIRDYNDSEVPTVIAEQLAGLSRIPDDRGVLPDILLKVRTAQQPFWDKDGPLWDYCRDGIGIFIKAATEEVAAAYGKDFHERIAERFSVLRSPLFHGLNESAGDDWSIYRDEAGLMGQIDRLLRPSGELASLQGDYRYEQLKEVEVELALEPKDEELDRFLTELRTFLYKGEDELNGQISFSIRPLGENKNAPWDRGYWYVGSHESAADYSPASLPQLNLQKHFDWDLGQHDRLWIGWSESTDSFEECFAKLEIESRLAPLILAWHCLSFPDDSREHWHGTVLLGGLKIGLRMDFADPLPRLPGDWSFPSGG